jgi:hypothetical protein
MNASQMITVQMTVAELLVLQSLLARASGAPAPSTPQKAPKAALEAPGAPKKDKKAKKEKDADAPKKAPNAWIVFTQQVRAALTAAGIKAGVEVTQFCGMLKAKNADYSAWTPELVLAEHGSWQKPEKKASLPALVPVAAPLAASPPASPVAAAEPEAKAKKARKPQSEETKKAAAEKRAATKAKKAAPAPLPASPVAAAEEIEFSTWTYKGTPYLKNENGDVLSEEFEWVGRYVEKTNTIDRSVAKPAYLEEE